MTVSGGQLEDNWVERRLADWYALVLMNISGSRNEPTSIFKWTKTSDGTYGWDGTNECYVKNAHLRLEETWRSTVDMIEVYWARITTTCRTSLH